MHLAHGTTQAAARRGRVDALSARAPIVDFNGAIAQQGARVFVEPSHPGEPIPAINLTVAATALHLVFTVLMGPSGERHFRRVAGLDVVELQLPPTRGQACQSPVLVSATRTGGSDRDVRNSQVMSRLNPAEDELGAADQLEQAESRTSGNLDDY